MGKVWLICRKDLQEAFGQRPLILRPLIGAALMPFLLVYSIAAHPGLMRAPGFTSFLLPFYLLLLAFGGSTLTLITAATAIAGEKERRTSEALLAAPITDRDLFLGKALAAFLPGVIVGYLVQLLFAALVTGIAASNHIAVEISPRAVAVAAALVPLLTLLVAATGMIVSARSSTVLSGMQLGTLVSLPVTGGAMYVAFKAMDGPPAWALRCLGLLLLVGVLLLRAGTRLVNREAIVSRM
jgi:ABC-type Na+ efflux pump permease subunit